MKHLMQIFMFVTLLLLSPSLYAQNGPLRIEITEAVIEPMPFAIPDFVARDANAAQIAQQISRVVAADLSSTGLFREVARDAHISRVSSVNEPIRFQDWRVINAEALIVGEVESQGNNVVLRFRLYDVNTGSEMGRGMELVAPASSARRLGHKLADQVYSRITGEGPYFDTRIAFISESGPKGQREKRLAIMDQDGANLRYLTGAEALVLAPRIAPDGRRIMFTSYASGQPEIRELELATLSSRRPVALGGSVSFAPRYAPDGRRIVYSAISGDNTDLYSLDLQTGARSRLTSEPSIETAPSYAPDGRRIVFESDRSGTQQLYIMSASGGQATRISRGEGRYATPVWSPRGDLIAFTKQLNGRFHIGVMNLDGSGERLLTSSFLDEGPSWSPNGRVIVFTRETQGEAGQAALYSVDISGRNLQRIRTQEGASDPVWSPLLP